MISAKRVNESIVQLEFGFVFVESDLSLNIGELRQLSGINSFGKVYRHLFISFDIAHVKLLFGLDLLDSELWHCDLHGNEVIILNILNPVIYLGNNCRVIDSGDFDRFLFEVKGLSSLSP